MTDATTDDHWILFLDDERDPEQTVRQSSWRSMVGLPVPTGAAAKHLGSDQMFRIARTVEEAKGLIGRYGMPTFISFDHDLGEDSPPAIEFAKYLVEKDLDGITFPDGFSWFVHSANPVGRANIESYMENYMRFRTAEPSSRTTV